MKKTRWTCWEMSEMCAGIQWEGREGRLLVAGDRHQDSTEHLSKLHRKILLFAKREGLPVMEVGDTFDVMQGREDRRRSHKKEGLEGENYLDLVIARCADEYEEFAPQLAYMGMGNHETAVLKNQGVHLLDGLKRELQRRGAFKGGKGFVVGGYRGWVKCSFRYGGTVFGTSNLYWHHGAGGGGEVAMGVQKAKRRAVYVPDADVVVGGHIHESWRARVARIRLTERGEERKDTQLHVSVPSLKDASTGKGGGWEVEKEMCPKPHGATLLEFKLVRAPNGRWGTQVTERELLEGDV